jgi:hypothetical protein
VLSLCFAPGLPKLIKFHCLARQIQDLLSARPADEARRNCDFNKQNLPIKYNFKKTLQLVDLAVSRSTN